MKTNTSGKAALAAALIIGGVLLVGVGTYLVTQEANTPHTESPETNEKPSQLITLDDVKNASFKTRIGSKEKETEITLEDGTYSGVYEHKKENQPNKSINYTVKLLDNLIALGDINGDNVGDAVFMVKESYEEELWPERNDDHQPTDTEWHLIVLVSEDGESVVRAKKTYPSNWGFDELASLSIYPDGVIHDHQIILEYGSRRNMERFKSVERYVLTDNTRTGLERISWYPSRPETDHNMYHQDGVVFDFYDEIPLCEDVGREEKCMSVRVVNREVKRSELNTDSSNGEDFFADIEIGGRTFWKYYHYDDMPITTFAHAAEGRTVFINFNDFGFNEFTPSDQEVIHHLILRTLQIFPKDKRRNVRISSSYNYDVDTDCNPPHPIDLFFYRYGDPSRLIYDDLWACTSKNKTFEVGTIGESGTRYTPVEQKVFDYRNIRKGGEVVGAAISWGGPDDGSDTYWSRDTLYIFFNIYGPPQTVLLTEYGPEKHGQTRFDYKIDPGQTHYKAPESYIVEISPNDLDGCTQVGERGSRENGLARYTGLKLVDNLSIITQSDEYSYGWHTAWNSDKKHTVSCIAELWHPTKDKAADWRYLHKSDFTNIHPTVESGFQKIEFSLGDLTWSFDVNDPRGTMKLISS